MGILPDTVENRQWVDNVHPAGWINPTPAGRYNLVVIGAGTAGLVCAAGAAGLGARVALIERNLMGGDCLNFGCVPSKGVIRAARAVHDARNSAGFGTSGNHGFTFDFSTAMERMRRIRADISHHDSARRFRDELGVDVFIGGGRFCGPDCIQVGDAKLFFTKAAICSGARAAAPPIPGLAEAGFHTNETIFSLTELPPRLAVIGAGPIGCELAQTFARFGSRVTLIATGARILGHEDPDAAKIMDDVLCREGLDLQLGVTIQEVRKNGNERIIHLESKGITQEIAVDGIVIGVGRIPNIEDLGLEEAGITCDSNGVAVNDMLQTTNPSVYAAGDVCSCYKFTHTADAHARILLANALFMGRQKTSSLIIPWCTYTDPEIAHVGMYEQEAQQQGHQVTTLTVPLTDIDRSIIDGESQGFARVHLKAGSDRILGATIVARHAGEMISEFSLAMTNGLGLKAIAGTIHPYPTQSESLKKLGDAYNRSRLTSFAKRLLAGWLKWQRR